MIKNYIEKANFEDTGFSYTLSLINGKYKMVILYCLMEFGVVRYSELKRKRWKKTGSSSAPNIRRFRPKWNTDCRSAANR